MQKVRFISAAVTTLTLVFGTATAGTAFPPSNNEIGFTIQFDRRVHPAPAVTRSAMPADGWRFVNNEIGYAFEGSPRTTGDGERSLARREGSLVPPVGVDGWRFLNNEQGYTYTGLERSAAGRALLAGKK